MYAVFEKEDRICIIQITRVVRQYFGYKITITKEEIDFLYYFLYTGLSFDDTDEIPEYSDRFQRNKHRILLILLSLGLHKFCAILFLLL